MSRVLSVIVLAGLLSAGTAQALPSYPVPLYMPEPDYPASMRYALVKTVSPSGFSFRPMAACAFLKCRGQLIRGSSA